MMEHMPHASGRNNRVSTLGAAVAADHQYTSSGLCSIRSKIIRHQALAFIAEISADHNFDVLHTHLLFFFI